VPIARVVPIPTRITAAVRTRVRAFTVRPYTPLYGGALAHIHSTLKIVGESTKPSAEICDSAAAFEHVLQVEEFVVLLIPLVFFLVVEVVVDRERGRHRASFIVGTKEACPAGEASGS
jgi:hypothetical protein